MQLLVWGRTICVLQQCPCWSSVPAGLAGTGAAQPLPALQLPEAVIPQPLPALGGLSPSLGTQAAGRDRDSLSLCSAGSVPGTAELRCRGQALTHDDTDESIKHSSCGTTRHWHITTTPLGRGQRGGDPSLTTALNSLWKSKAGNCGIIQMKEKATSSFSTRGVWGRTVPAAGTSRAAVPRWTPGHAWAAQVGCCA